MHGMFSNGVPLGGETNRIWVRQCHISRIPLEIPPYVEPLCHRGEKIPPRQSVQCILNAKTALLTQSLGRVYNSSRRGAGPLCPKQVIISEITFCY